MRNLLCESPAVTALRFGFPTVFFSITIILLFNHPLSAQTFYGSIVGTVTDASGGVIPGATVTLTNIGTAERRIADTDATGTYRFVNLIPGNYRVDIEMAGFKRFTREPIVVEVQSAVRIDVSMQIGEINQTVEVSSATPLLQTENTSLGQVVDSRQVLEMPLNGRNVLNLVALVPGVVPQGGAMQAPTGQNIFSWGNYQIGGGTANQSASYLDGGPLNVNYVNLTALVPTQDAVQEFRVQTNNLGPEFGRFSGGVVNLASKSGTNSFHGSAYEFIRNRVLNANTFFNNRSGIARAPYTQNQYGVNLGGPAIKDKTFFFFSFEGYRQRQGLSFLWTVPTDALREGDFSNLRDAKGNLIKIYDPLTTCGRLGNPACPVDSTGKEIITRQQFPGNVIPPNRTDPTAKALMRNWARANLAGQPFTNVQNFASNASAGGDHDQYNVRIDQNVSSNQRIFGRYTDWRAMNIGPDPYGVKTYYQNTNPQTFRTRQVVIADTYTFTPTTVGDFRVAFLRFEFNVKPDLQGIDLTTFGWPASYNNQVAFRVLPIASVSGFNGGSQQNITARNNSYSLAPSLTKIVGRHTLKFGGEVRRLDFNFAQVNNASGSFSFNDLFTSANPFAPAGTGSSWASYLLGYGTSGSVGVPAFTASQCIYQGYYASDMFQVNSKLTLNLGLRWEFPGAWTERYDRLVVLLPDAVSPLAQATALSLKGRLGLVSSPDRPDRHLTDSRKLFAPRVGFAYRFWNNTVMRGAYGIFYIPSDAIFVGANNNPVTSITTAWVSTLDGSLTPAGKLSDPFPNGILQPPGRNPTFQSILQGQSPAAPIPGGPYGYMQQWNFGIQRQLMEGTALEMAYAGARGVHLVMGQALNQLSDQYLSLGSKLQQQVPNPFYGLITSGTLAANTVAYGQLLRPYPQYTGVSNQLSFRGNLSYHSMQVKLERRFRERGVFLASYAWSKSIGDTETGTSWLETGGLGSTQNNNNFRLERSLSSFDVPHRMVLSYVLDLPVGKGKTFWGGASGILDKLISGWGFNGFCTFQSGYPLHLTTATNLTNSFGGGSRPNNNGQSAKLDGSAQSRLNHWFKTENFSPPPAFTFGNVSRTLPDVRGAGANNWDFALFKNTKLTERVGLQFRGEIFNLFNRVQFELPGQSLGNPQFGIVSSQVNNPRLMQFALRLVY